MFLIILHCNYANSIWVHLQPISSQLDAKVFDEVEKALGKVKIKKSPGMILRNWLEYKLQEQILLFESQSRVPSVDMFKAKFKRQQGKLRT